MERRTKRVYYYDVIRVIACFCILAIHFSASFSGWTGGVFLYPNSILPNYIFNNSIYLGSFGVSLFFILSGTAMYRAYGAKDISLPQFYKKRFLSIYPMFWIAWFVATGVAMLVNGGIASSGLKAAIATALGMDGYAMALGYYSFSGFYQVGEWYLGCILMLYLIMPLLIWGVKNHPLITGIISLMIFGLLYGRVSELIFLLRIPEVVFGMLFDRYFRPQKGRTRWFLIGGLAAGIILLSAAGNWFWTMGWSLVLCVLISVLFFCVVVLLFQNVKDPIIVHPIKWLTKYTYPIFLVHHQVCAYMSGRFNLSELPRRTCFFAFLVYLCITMIISILLERANYGLLRCFALSRVQKQVSDWKNE